MLYFMYIETSASLPPDHTLFPLAMHIRHIQCLFRVTRDPYIYVHFLPPSLRNMVRWGMHSKSQVRDEAASHLRVRLARKLCRRQAILKRRPCCNLSIHFLELLITHQERQVVCSGIFQNSVGWTSSDLALRSCLTRIATYMDALQSQLLTGVAIEAHGKRSTSSSKDVAYPWRSLGVSGSIFEIGLRRNSVHPFRKRRVRIFHL
ncbi:hypothetical protein BDZ45DRAFT_362346 [Acephala macrosclerotiorum]|nr:hypothetical protein BDZ45DRAFT_362346 [Acephala macrosclerotiorum]